LQTRGLVEGMDFMSVSEFQESVKIVKEEEEPQYMCVKVKRIAYNSVVRTQDSGDRGYLNV